VHDDVRAESSGSRDDGDGLGDLVDGIAADVGLSGVIRIDLEGSLAVQQAYGLAHRGLGVPNTVDTQFATASGTKSLTALTVMSLVERGELGLTTASLSRCSSVTGPGSVTISTRTRWPITTTT
jgi:CubicO group peptidase (beta-lactamase class C family)